MNPNEISSTLEKLRASTDRLLASTERANLDAAEAAMADREIAVRKLSEIVSQSANVFSTDEFKELCACEARGKRAIEMLLQRRREGWVKAGQLATNQHILQSFR